MLERDPDQQPHVELEAMMRPVGGGRSRAESDGRNYYAPVAVSPGAAAMVRNS